jgi:preprotein translocase subunit SecA
MYSKLAGMTGTAATEAEEFGDIYGLDVVEVPTNVPIARIDEDDEVYRTVEEKYQAIINDIKEAREPEAAGSGRHHLDREIGNARRSPAQARASDFNVLNARYHEQEAYIVSQAGVPGAITIATNMAGRGTDIQLGGNADMRIAQELGDMPEGPEARREGSRNPGRDPGTQG